MNSNNKSIHLLCYTLIFWLPALLDHTSKIPQGMHGYAAQAYVNTPKHEPHDHH